MNVSQALGTATVLVVIVIAVFLILFFANWSGIERGRKLLLRPLLPLNQLRRMVQESAETGQTVHYSPGTGSLNGQNATAETLSGITTLGSVAQVAARSKGYLATTSNDALTYLAANDTVSAEYDRAGRLEDFQQTNSRFVTQQDPIAYIAGVGAFTSQQQVMGNIMLGRLGEEYLLAGDIANQRKIEQVVGSTLPQALPLMLLSAGTDNTLIGEEVYAAPAYLDREPAHLASLQTQDILRILLILAIIAGVIAASLNFEVGNLFLR